jgi:hypothetical protein
MVTCAQQASPPSEPPPTRLYANAEAVAAVARGSMVVPTIDDMEEYSTLPPHNLPACDVLAPDDLYSDLRTGLFAIQANVSVST